MLQPGERLLERVRGRKGGISRTNRNPWLPLIHHIIFFFFLFLNTSLSPFPKVLPGYLSMPSTLSYTQLSAGSLYTLWFSHTKLFVSESHISGHSRAVPSVHDYPLRLRQKSPPRWNVSWHLRAKTVPPLRSHSAQQITALALSKVCGNYLFTFRLPLQTTVWDRIQLQEIETTLTFQSESDITQGVAYI